MLATDGLKDGEDLPPTPPPTPALRKNILIFHCRAYVNPRYFSSNFTFFPLSHKVFDNLQRMNTGKNGILLSKIDQTKFSLEHWRLSSVEIFKLSFMVPEI
jgi:hypothetical protein